MTRGSVIKETMRMRAPQVKGSASKIFRTSRAQVPQASLEKSELSQYVNPGSTLLQIQAAIDSGGTVFIENGEYNQITSVNLSAQLACNVRTGSDALVTFSIDVYPWSTTSADGGAVSSAVTLSPGPHAIVAGGKGGCAFTDTDHNHLK